MPQAIGLAGGLARSVGSFPASASRDVVHRASRTSHTKRASRTSHAKRASRARATAQNVIHLAHLGVHRIRKAWPDICLQNKLRANARFRQHESRILHHPHHLIVFAFYLGEHGIGPVREAGIADHLHRLRHIGRKLLPHAKWRNGKRHQGIHVVRILSVAPQ